MGDPGVKKVSPQVSGKARNLRIAYQIWWLINDTAGECTLRDMVDLTGASLCECQGICQHRGWGGQYRKLARETSHCDLGPEPLFFGDLGVRFA